VETVRKIVKLFGGRQALKAPRFAWEWTVRELADARLQLPGLRVTRLLILRDRVTVILERSDA
jgi:hypothetical protein